MEEVYSMINDEDYEYDDDHDEEEEEEDPQGPRADLFSFASNFQFADTASMGFEDHPIEYLLDDGYEYIQLSIGGDKAKYLKSVTFVLALCDEDNIPFVFFGEESDIFADWEDGVFRDNLRGVWGGIDGHPVMWHVTSITDEYVLYEAPIKIDGLLYNLNVAYNTEDASYKMLSAKLDESETGGISSKNERLLVAGDEVTTVFFALDRENGTLVPFDNETFTISKDSAFEETTLPDGIYAFMYLMTDYRDNLYYSDMTAIVMEDGEVDIIDF